MHEMGLCEAVLAVVRDVSDPEPVRRVRLRVGRLQGVVPECGAVSVDLIGGDEQTVEEVELEDGEVRRNPALASAARGS